MFDMVQMCERRGLKVPTPKTDYRGRTIYRLMVYSDELYAVANELHNGNCKPCVKICDYAKETVELIENRKREAWYFRFYARNAEHAETVIEELLSIIQPHRNYQDVFDI